MTCFGTTTQADRGEELTSASAPTQATRMHSHGRRIAAAVPALATIPPGLKSAFLLRLACLRRGKSCLGHGHKALPPIELLQHISARTRDAFGHEKQGSNRGPGEPAPSIEGSVEGATRETGRQPGRPLGHHDRKSQSHQQYGGRRIDHGEKRVGVVHALLVDLALLLKAFARSRMSKTMER